jgi:hypothetical protein
MLARHRPRSGCVLDTNKRPQVTVGWDCPAWGQWQVTYTAVGGSFRLCFVWWK